MYDKVPKTMNFSEREHIIRDFWAKENIFEKSVALRSESDDFTFFDGPPTANGKPHIGHVLTRTIKDLFPRYKTMKGYRVLRKAGWDTHGLPVELEVERALDINGKPGIESFGVAPFIEKCKESVWTYESVWREMSERVGFWADMDDPYVTYHNDYIESVWWALKTIWDKGLIYKGHKVVPYCPRCGTALSSHEVAQGYEDVREQSVFVKFKRKGTDDEYFLAWTTTPWTLPSNIALTVNADEDYVRAKVKDDVYIMADALTSDVLGSDFTVIDRFKGKTLEFAEYEPLFPFVDDLGGKNGYIVVCDDYVTLTDGTGIVHCAPAFGEDDYRVGRNNNLAFVQLVDAEGLFTQQADHYAGLFVKDADKRIIADMKANGSLLYAKDYEHSYPFCWRCHTPLIYYARDTWFIKMTDVREDLLKNNAAVNWVPETVGTGRFGNWLENVMDWGISRERYWGTPLNIWECSCGHKECIGSVVELREKGRDVPADIDLHKPVIDAVRLTCPTCGGVMKRVSEVIDCWFDSGAMPFAQYHYPFENKETFEQHFPADFISEAIDQTRGWFYTLMAISTVLFDKSPYKNVVVLGHVLDKNGFKLSKSKGNYVDPLEAIEQLSADAIRWYFCYNSAPWLPSRFFDEAVLEGQRKFMGTLRNSYAFYVLYADIDDFNPTEHEDADLCRLPVIDRWILSRLNSVIKCVDAYLSKYGITEAARAINDFLDDLSNWYLRRCRERFWASGMESDKVSAYKTLHNCLVTTIKLAAPFTPFISEDIYQNIVRNVDPAAPESVHLTDFPVFDERFIDGILESNMDMARRIVVLGRSARNAANIKNRQPLAHMYVKTGAELLPNTFIDIVAEELNVKSVSFIDETEQFASYKIKPQLKTLGPKYGKILPKISLYLQGCDGNAFMKDIRSGGAAFDIEGTLVTLTEPDVLVETGQKDGFVGDSDRGVSVVLDITLTDELIEEGFVREIISKVQTMRKEADFDVMDKIRLSIKGSAVVKSVLDRNAEEIKRETLTAEITPFVDGYTKLWDINGEEAEITVANLK